MNRKLKKQKLRFYEVIGTIKNPEKGWLVR